MKILIVDDSRAMRQIVKRALRQAGFDGHETLEAEDGPQALERIESGQPDVVLCDWNMPGMTGLEVLESLGERAASLEFGFVTTESTDEMREIARAAGAKFLIAKPFTPQSMQTALTPILG